MRTQGNLPDYEELGFTEDEFQQAVTTLKIRPASKVHGKHSMISFIAENHRLVFFFNSAIGSVMKDAALNPFHQVGNLDEPGYHAWEHWTSNTPDSALEALFPEIISTVKRYMENW